MEEGATVTATSPHQKRHFGHQHFEKNLIENTSSVDGHLSDMLANSTNHFYAIKPPQLERKGSYEIYGPADLHTNV